MYAVDSSFNQATSQSLIVYISILPKNAKLEEDRYVNVCYIYLMSYCHLLSRDHTRGQFVPESVAVRK